MLLALGITSKSLIIHHETLYLIPKTLKTHSPVNLSPAIQSLTPKSLKPYALPRFGEECFTGADVDLLETIRGGGGVLLGVFCWFCWVSIKMRLAGLCGASQRIRSGDVISRWQTGFLGCNATYTTFLRKNLVLELLQHASTTSL